MSPQHTSRHGSAHLATSEPRRGHQSGTKMGTIPSPRPKKNTNHSNVVPDRCTERSQNVARHRIADGCKSPGLTIVGQDHHLEYSTQVAVPAPGFRPSVGPWQATLYKPVSHVLQWQAVPRYVEAFSWHLAVKVLGLTT